MLPIAKEQTTTAEITSAPAQTKTVKPINLNLKTGSPEWGKPDNGGYRIIAVDDEPINLEVIRAYLSDEKYKVHTMTSGMNLMEIISESAPIELLILDIFMPEISGYHLCSDIRKKYPSHELPILMLTASSNPEDMVHAFSLGANDYITKPVSRTELLARVDTHIQLKQSVSRMKLSSQKLNEIDRLIHFGFLVSTYLLRDRISADQERIVLKKAYEYHKPLLNEHLTEFSYPINDNEEENFENIIKTLRNLDSSELIKLFTKIEETVQIDTQDTYRAEEIENITSDVFDLVSQFLLIWNSENNSEDEFRRKFNTKHKLTMKETETAELIFQGFSNIEIAEKMDISLSTVKKHIYSIFNKVGVENRTHLIYQMLQKK